MGVAHLETMLANVGTPLILFGACHLLVLNLLIGFIEGRWIARRTSSGTATWGTVMILANYASAFVGAALLGPMLWLIASAFGGPMWITGLLPATVLLPIGALGATMVVESMFVLVGGLITKVSLAKSIKAFAVIQLLTFLPIVAVYALASDFSAVASLRWRPGGSSVVDGTTPGWIYFLSADDSEVRRCRLDGSTVERVFDLRHAGLDPEGRSYIRAPLYAAPIDVASTSRIGDVCSLRLAQAARWPDDPVIVSNLPGRAGLFEYHQGESAGRPASEVERFDAGWTAAAVGASGSPPTRVRISADFFTDDGIAGDPRLDVAYQTTMLTWSWQSPTVVEGRYVVAGVRAWRDRFIVVIDMDTHRAAVVAEGWSPVVVLEIPQAIVD